MTRHTGATWRIQLNRPSAAAMQSYVKLLWPLVNLACCSVKCASCAVHRDNKTYTHTYVKVAYYCARQLTTTIAILICKLVFNFNLITLMHKNSEPQYTDTQHTTTDQVRMVFRDVASNFCLGSPKRTIHFLTMTQVWNLSNRGMGRRGGLDWAGFNVPLNTL